MIELGFAIIGVTLRLLLRRLHGGSALAPATTAAVTVSGETTAEPQPAPQSSAAVSEATQDPVLTFPAQHELASVIGSTPELQALYASLGYAPELEQQATHLLRQAMALIETTLPDFTAFRRCVLQVQSQLEAPPATHPTAALLWQERRQKAQTDPLWQAVVAAGDDPAQVLRLLNGDAVFTPLPFIEQVPYLSHGQVRWRTPVEVPGLHKRPGDIQRFSSLLDRLEELLDTPGVAWHAQGRQEALDAMARVRRELQRPHGYLPTSLQALQHKVQHCVQQAPFSSALAQRQALDRCLSLCLAIQRTYGWEQQRALSAAALTRMRELTQQQAQYYLHTVWMQTPWLTTRLVTNLLDAELAALPADIWQRHPAPAAPLRLIRAEIASGLYDPGETLRRLRQCEEHGMYVHSLVFPLLRLQRTPGNAWQQPCVALATS
ncbi:MAG: hypothetical protein AB7N91_24670 [Candidatus Tectimicrobiota bacterium]